MASEPAPEKPKEAVAELWERFTRAGFEAAQARAAKERETEEFRKRRGIEGRVRGGELEAFEKPDAEDDELADGQPVPTRLGRCPPQLIGFAMHEIDPTVKRPVSRLRGA